MSDALNDKRAGLDAPAKKAVEIGIGLLFLPDGYQESAKALKFQHGYPSIN